MIFITSIAPQHINEGIQKIATDSWLQFGHVYSMNSIEEVNLLEEHYPEVNFIPTNRTMELTYGKPYVSINAILDWCKEKHVKSVCIINSDIELRCDKDLIEKIENEIPNQVLMANRIDCKNGQEYKFIDGIDMFFIHENFLKIFPQSMFALGQCHWDYWIPYTCAKSGVKASFIRNPIGYHKKHNQQYNHDSWAKTGRFFLWQSDLKQFQYQQGIPAMSKYVFNYINNASKTINL